MAAAAPKPAAKELQVEPDKKWDWLKAAAAGQKHFIGNNTTGLTTAQAPSHAMTYTMANLGI